MPRAAYMELLDLLFGRVANKSESSCGTAFTHPTYGAMLLQASMSFSVTLARFTLQLNRRPDLTRRIRSVDEDSGGKSVAESSAEIIQKIFTTCLTDRSVGRVPEGKKVGVYMFANLVLKLLFAVCPSLPLFTSYFSPLSKFNASAKKRSREKQTGVTRD